VYVLTNPSMPGMVKIGYTNRLSEDRTHDLYGTSIPLPFNVEYRRITSNPTAVERRAHELLSHRRINPRREFFSTDPLEAAAVVERACLETAGIQSWERDRPISLRSNDSLALTLRKNQLLIPLAYSITNGWEPVDIWQSHSDGDLLEIMVRDSASHMAGFSGNAANGAIDPIPHLDRGCDVPNWPLIGREHVRPGCRLLWLEGPDDSPRCSIALFEINAHCQIACRTQTPRLHPNGLPLILNYFTADPSPAAISVIQTVLQMTPPRQLGDLNPRTSEPQSEDIAPVTPAYWLPQLKKREPKPRGPHSI